MANNDAATFRAHTEKWGPSDTPTNRAPRALLLHGITSSARTWWQIAEGLADAGWSVTAPDLRGHGRSPRTGEYRIDDFADDVFALGTSWDLLVGHSLGGAIAVVALHRDSRLARRTVLIDPALQLDSSAEAPFLRTTLAAMAAVDPDAIAAANPNWHARTIQARVDSYREVDPDAVTAIVQTNQPWDVLGHAARLSTPVHVIAADPANGASFSAADGHRLRTSNPNWTYEVVPGASHSVHRDEPGLVIERLLG